MASTNLASVAKRAKLYGDLVMFRHTLFSLPFAGIGALLGARGIPTGWDTFWILVAMFGARNGANALNRLVDKDIDPANPRTRSRHLPQGLVKEWEVLLLVIVGFSLFVLAAAMLDPLCLLLLPIPLVIFIIYSYTKRFTWLCHYVLGAASGGAPVGAWMAVTGRIELPALMLGAAVALWVAGFDIIYGTLDIKFDRSFGIHSVPARFGAKRGLQIAALSHLGTIVGLVITGLWMGLGWMYWIGIVIAAVLLWWEHRLVSPDNLTHVKLASYNVNEVLAPLLFGFTLADVLLRWVLV